MTTPSPLPGPAFIGEMSPSPETSRRWWTMYCRECGIEETMYETPDDPRLIEHRDAHNREHQALAHEKAWREATPSPLPTDEDAREVPLSAILAVYRDGDERGWVNEFNLLEETHGPKLDMLKTSIQEDGIREPIVLGPDGRVWDGHHRLCAAESLGIEKVPVVFAGEGFRRSAVSTPPSEYVRLALEAKAWGEQYRAGMSQKEAAAFKGGHAAGWRDRGTPVPAVPVPPTITDEARALVDAADAMTVDEVHNHPFAALDKLRGLTRELRAALGGEEKTHE